MAINNPQVKQEFEKYETKLNKALEHFKTEMNSVRAGRANPHILNKIVIDYYGTMTPLSQMANITVPEARLLVISLWDSKATKDVIKAIVASDLGLNPSDDGKTIRIVFPQLTAERRKDLAKQIKKISEEAKVVLRNERRDIIETLKKFKKDNIVTEDEIITYEKDIQKTLDKNSELVDKVLKEKEIEILEV